ncbi:hypothetical protein AMTR_s00085p00136920 [Amborella trichopoda]|uniref:TIR domain-containing protein n=1 Tax=Amborella trichopoda TaxID=13333 RepID=W1P6X0_AMBTC|nr:hypothetical protein AMTR_s00085p00136920 [Amborella trichopoda]
MDVFLNFSKDTGKGFTAHLHNALKQSGLSTSFTKQQQQQEDGDDNTKIGEIILPSDTQRAIENSQVFICIFSSNYPSCVSCLEELSFVVRLEGRTILPVFYHVEPFHVGRQAGVFKAAFQDHENRYDGKRVERWRDSLKEVGKISGWDLGDGNEADLIDKVVEWVLANLNYTSLYVADHIVGLDSRVSEVVGLLDVNADDVRIIGIHGMGGIGKTTLAKAVYNKIFSGFEGSCFLSDIRDHGLVSLQKQLLRDLFHEGEPDINHVDKGMLLIRNKVRSKRVLVILDDVDHKEQLEKLAGKREWYCPGSRIIVTTRDEHVLNVHRVDRCHIYELKVLNDSQSLQLFSKYAFGVGQPGHEFIKLSNIVVTIAGGLPLALKVFGSYLLDKTTIEEWEDAVRKLENIPEDDILFKLKISYDGLAEEDKWIFLDIACFFIGMDRDYAIDIWKGCDLYASIPIKNLLQKSLITFDGDNKLQMHDQLRDMGRRIVKLENLGDPGRRSRLWFQDDVFDVLKYRKGTEKVRGLILNLGEKDESSTQERHWDIEAFEPMINLKLLRVSYAFIDGSFKVLPSELVWLQWQGCPFGSVPNDFNPGKLVVLDLSRSKIKHVWKEASQNKSNHKLKVLDLGDCYFLLRTPNFSPFPNLEKLNLQRCVSLVEVHRSIGHLNELIYLNMTGCTDLKELPNDISRMCSLQKLLLSECVKLSKLPEQLGSLKSLRELLIDRTAIEKLPKSIGSLKRLRKISLSGCLFLKELPTSIGELLSLQELTLDGTAIRELPNSIGSLKKLEILSARWCGSLTVLPNTIGDLESLLDLLLEKTSISELPNSLGKLSNLRRLWVTGCKSLNRIPESVGELNVLVQLRVDGTQIIGLPDSIETLSELEELDIRRSILFSRLPVSIGNLSRLTIVLLDNTIITELPDSIGSLVNLKKLSLRKCKKFSRLPASMGKMKSLRHLNIEETAIVKLPDDFGSLSSLNVLKMPDCPQFKEFPQNFGSLTSLRTLDIHNNGKLTRLPSALSCLHSMEELNANHCNLEGSIPDEFEKLYSLTTLRLRNNKFHQLPSSMRGLSQLKTLFLSHCTQLRSIPELPTSLAILDAVNCTALQTISDLSHVSKLQELRLTNCERLIDIQGIDQMKSLRQLLLNGCSPRVSRSIAKETFNHLWCFGISGSKVPDWFMFQKLSCTVPRLSDQDLKIRGVILCFVISHNSEIPIDFVPDIPDVLFMIIRNGTRRFSTMLRLGVPKAHQDQVYLFHFQEGGHILPMLEGGDQIEVAKRSPPMFPSIQLKKGGIHLVYKPEQTQDYIQEKLAEFCNSMDCHENLPPHYLRRKVQAGILLWVFVLLYFVWMRSNSENYSPFLPSLMTYSALYALK